MAGFRPAAAAAVCVGQRDGFVEAKGVFVWRNSSDIFCFLRWMRDLAWKRSLTIISVGKGEQMVAGMKENKNLFILRAHVDA